MAETPQSIEKHQQDYSNKAWEMYSLMELGSWVHNLVKRASHRTNLEKRAKDLTDARNYLNMMQAKLGEARAELLAAGYSEPQAQNSERRAEKALNKHGMSLTD